MASYLTHLECSQCGHVYSSREKQTICQSCQSQLLARYGLCQFSQSINPSELDKRQEGIWRWHELLPVHSGQYRITLGEADTPLISLPRTAKKVGATNLYCKDESSNPAGTFSAREACVALAKAAELGITQVALASAEDEGAAFALYASRLGIDAHVYMPKQSKQSSRNEVISYGAHLHLVDGDLADVCEALTQDSTTNHWYNLSCYQEPYRLEGIKTIGLEIARQMDWISPDWVIFPSVSMIGVLGVWKAFAELHEMGWISIKPKLVWAKLEQNKQNPVRSREQQAIQVADKLIPEIINGDGALAVSVLDAELDAADHQVLSGEGVLMSPEGESALLALQSLRKNGTILENDRIVFINTASGFKNL